TRQRVLDQDVAIVQKTAPPGHALGGVVERFSAQHSRWDSQLFEFRGVVQTAPGTRPSITDRRDDQVDLRGKLRQLLRFGQHPRLALRQDRPDDLHVVALLQQVADLDAQLLGIGLHVVEQTNAFALQPSQAGRNAMRFDPTDASRVQGDKRHDATTSPLISRVTKSPGGTAYTHVGMTAVKPPLPPPATTTRMSSGTRTRYTYSTPSILRTLRARPPGVAVRRVFSYRYSLICCLDQPFLRP